MHKTNTTLQKTYEIEYTDVCVQNTDIWRQYKTNTETISTTIWKT